MKSNLESIKLKMIPNPRLREVSVCTCWLHAAYSARVIPGGRVGHVSHSSCVHQLQWRKKYTWRHRQEPSVVSKAIKHFMKVSVHCQAERIKSLLTFCEVQAPLKAETERVWCSRSAYKDTYTHVHTPTTFITCSWLAGNRRCWGPTPLHLMSFPMVPPDLNSLQHLVPTTSLSHIVNFLNTLYLVKKNTLNLKPKRFNVKFQKTSIDSTLIKDPWNKNMSFVLR